MKPLDYPARELNCKSILLSCALSLCFVARAAAQPALTLVSHYTCAANSGFYQADSSGNNNNLNGGGSWTQNATWGWTSNAIAGGGALVLDGGENISFYSPPPGDQPFDSWLATFYGSFSISLWVNTTNVLGNDSDTLNCCNDAQIIYAYSYYYPGVDDTIPIALTGHKVAFFTGDPTGNNGDTLHSTNTVTTGQWVQIVVTRDGTTGQKSIYVNGTLDSSDYGVTNNLDGEDITYYDIGGGPGYSYAGGLDDMQFYSGVLSAAQVAFLYANPGLTVTNVPSPTGLLAFYDFDEGTTFAADLSANSFNLANGGNFGGPVLSTDSVTGHSVYFNGGSFLTPSSNLLATIAGDFSLSLWVKTSQYYGYADNEVAYNGAGIVAADVPGVTNDLIPMALTGGAIGFNTGSGNGGSDDTINSTTDINDGNYHHVVVTRVKSTGQKTIYIDGQFSASDTTNPGLLNSPQLITIGALADASQSDPTSPESTGYNGYVGLIDDIQIYSRVLSTNEVGYLYSKPGATTNGLAAHYDFAEGTVLAEDVSGHGNNMVFAGAFNGPGPAITADAESGMGALDFDGSGFLVPNNNFVTNLAGSFSLSVWLQTTQSLGNPGDPADNGAGVVTAEVSSQLYDLIPLALTGGYVAFETDGDNTDVLDSATAINDGSYHHVVVTRDGASGAKQIYIDGTLSASDVSDTALLNNPQILVLGCLADASQSDPNSPTQDGANGYAGLMDQLQFYGRVISSSEVTYLYDNPGAVLATNVVSSGPPLGVALDATNLTWSTTGDASWFGETTNTYSTNAAAAQSGSLQDGQSSILQTTVTGPGTISFYWETIANNDDFTLVFDIDGNQGDNINGQSSWSQDTFTIQGSGTHTLTWNANTVADNGSSPTDAGFVDQVVFTPVTPPVITLNPFDQTNYPGYEVALFAAASNSLPPTRWQWYKVGNANPIPQATNALYIPSSSGTSAVAGSYYAVASNSSASQTTSTAVVTFVNAPLPPKWSTAFVSPLVDFDTNGEYYTTASNIYYACAVDSTGTNEYSVGYSAGSNYYNNSLQIASINGEIAAIIVKQNLASDNPVQWVVAITNNGNGNAYANGIALAPGGGIYVSGNFSGTNWLGTNKLNDAGEGTYFLARFDAGGNLIWMTTVSNSFPFLNSITSDASGNVTVAAIVNSSTTIGGTRFVVSGQASFLAQFNSSGALNWADHTSNTILYLANGGGRIYASLPNYIDGNTNNSIGGISNSTDRNWTIAALNITNGQGIWLRGVGEAYGQFPPSTIDDIPTISVSATNVFLVGTAYGSSAVFGSFTVPITGGRGQYFARYDTNGNPQLATAFGSTTTQPLSAVANSAGDVYVTGGFDTYSFFGNDLLAGPRIASFGSGYYSQSFLAKFDKTGTPQWALQAIASGGREAAVDFITLFSVSLGGNNVWVAGVGIGPVFFNPDLPTSNGYFDSNTGQEIALASGFLGMVTDIQPITPVTLLNPAIVGSNFQFSFLSSANTTNYVQYSTNLAGTNWLNYSAIVGDGTLKTVDVPASTPAAKFFRILTQ